MPWGKARASSVIFFPTACSTSSALAPGDWNTPMPVAGKLVERKHLAVGLRAQIHRTDIAPRVTSPLLPLLTMMSSNLARVVETSVDIERVLERLAGGVGGAPTWPGGDLLALLLDRLDDVLRHQSAQPCNLFGSSQNQHRIFRRRTP